MILWTEELRNESLQVTITNPSIIVIQLFSLSVASHHFTLFTEVRIYVWMAVAYIASSISKQLKVVKQANE